MKTYRRRLKSNWNLIKKCCQTRFFISIAATWFISRHGSHTRKSSNRTPTTKRTSCVTLVAESVVFNVTTWVDNCIQKCKRWDIQIVKKKNQCCFVNVRYVPCQKLKIGIEIFKWQTPNKCYYVLGNCLNYIQKSWGKSIFCELNWPARFLDFVFKDKYFLL